ncbi:conserved domain protein [Acidobacterium capsulatum ATCC 51196]|uniref:Conserved domain protein n=1 Tax=Acidobacterium capsulatum (strain ATCC 51196 / DSM 11244 / BCRC 80197 / JCM 7670 / NBRC 15755 / NCIMB 13165 / 161) TaxID=240015 RepID=C1F9L9_ACIC5|nr:conserved domain protein [Acidobacterium capsulatum ATCC 51196]
MYAASTQPPAQQHGEREDGRGKDERERKCCESKKAAVFPGVTPRLCKLARHQTVVTAIGLEGHDEEISRERDGTDEHFESDVDAHARECGIGHAAQPGRADKQQRGEPGEHVADAGDEADQAIETNADAGAGNAEPFIEQARQQIQLLVAEPTRRA